MLKGIFTLSLCLVGLGLFAQANLPSWLSADPNKQDLVYVTGMTINNQTSTEMPTSITIEQYGKDTLSHTFNTFEDHGNFEFFLRPDFIYHITYTKPGYLSKTLEVVTGNIPEDAWSLGFALEVDVTMEEELPTFDKKLQERPFARCMYSARTERIEFDKVYSKQQRAAWDKERDRCLNQ